ncbi:right-handed parallel beta-helix repeat-containing protein [Cohnella soli]|uniref:Right-handed parallel beta-helix repeat-containing protein n=1 Tax=Cohnella soli TaxID=425005 RepID=A0ABW0I2I0_9BACL
MRKMNAGIKIGCALLLVWGLMFSTMGAGAAFAETQSIDAKGIPSSNTPATPVAQTTKVAPDENMAAPTPSTEPAEVTPAPNAETSDLAHNDFSLEIAAPTGLAAEYEDGAMNLTWNPVEHDKLVGYNVFLDGVQVNGTLLKVNKYRLVGLEKEQRYVVQVSTVYQSNLSEGLTIGVPTDVPPKEEPVVPITGLRATGAPGSVMLQWEQAATDKAVGYNVYADGELLNAAGSTSSTTFMAQGLVYGHVYEFKIEAIGVDGKVVGKSDAVSGTPTHYLVELDRWGIRNDGSDPAGTTAGLNNMLQWAYGQGIHAVFLPSGTYTISKDSQINMVGDMLWELPTDAVIQKETNGKESYYSLAIQYGANNVTIKGGWYKGDRETHNYSGKDNAYSPGTHEGGFGIYIEGARNVTVEGVKATHFTGDGLMIGGAAQMGSDVYAGNFESGGLDASGMPAEDKNKVRTKNMYSLTKNQFVEQKFFELSNWQNASSEFEIDFYNDSNAFVAKTMTKLRARIDIPNGATKMKIVINKSGVIGIYGEYWQRLQAENTIVRNSEFAYNRRQGITVGGGNHTLIENNRIHDISGIAPMSGIDVEGGYGENGHWNSDVTIRNNEFWNNARYDVILYDGRGALVENNHLASKGVIGLAVSSSYAGDAIVKGNHFDGSRIIAYHDVQLLNNKLNDSYTTFEGPNIKIDGLDISNGTLAISAKSDGAVRVSNVTINITDNTKEGGLSVYGTGATAFRNVTISGQSKLRSFVGASTAANKFERLRVLDYNPTYGLSLPAGTYTDSEFVAAEGGRLGFVGISLPAKYVFERVRFQTNTMGSTAVVVQKAGADVTIRDSIFDMKGNDQAVSVQTASRFIFERNTVNAMAMLKTASELVRINDYWERANPYDVLDVLIADNTINANMAVLGIQTVYAGKDAPAYTIRDNTMNRAILSVKSNDIATGNFTNP